MKRLDTKKLRAPTVKYLFGAARDSRVRRTRKIRISGGIVHAVLVPIFRSRCRRRVWAGRAVTIRWRWRKRFLIITRNYTRITVAVHTRMTTIRVSGGTCTRSESPRQKAIFFYFFLSFSLPVFPGRPRKFHGTSERRVTIFVSFLFFFYRTFWWFFFMLRDMFRACSSPRATANDRPHSRQQRLLEYRFATGSVVTAHSKVTSTHRHNTGAVVCT